MSNDKVIKISMEDIPSEAGVELIPRLTRNYKTRLKGTLSMTEQTNQKGIKETCDVIAFVVKVGNVIHDVTAPGSAGGSAVKLIEYPQFLSAAMSFPSMVEGISQVPYELADEITEEEKEQIKTELMKSEQLQDANLNDAVEDHLNAAIVLKNLIFKYYVKQESAGTANV